jgi:tripartite-type tricarboxylate transporter receptor subunit TctC
MPTKAPRAAMIFSGVVANTPEEFARYIEAEYAKWAQVVKASGTTVP